MPSQLKPNLLIKKPKLLRSNPYRKSIHLVGLDTDIDDENLADIKRRRHEFNDLRNDLDKMELPDEIKFRLFLARAKALKRLKEIYNDVDKA